MRSNLRLPAIVRVVKDSDNLRVHIQFMSGKPIQSPQRPQKPLSHNISGLLRAI
jgi:hypothetical protein